LKRRADQLLVEKGLCESRAVAQRLILAGEVRVGDDGVVRKTSDLLDPAADLRVVAAYPYVSRGAEKLLAALRAFEPDLHGAVALDIGASTGGFTEVLLERGARRVYAVDVGYGQLHARLRADPRVVCLEKVNSRYLSAAQVPDPIDVLTADVSFISLRKALEACRRLLKTGAWVFVLVKPQFEARREEIAHGGVVRDAAVRERCVNDIRHFLEEEFGCRVLGAVPSPILGPKGNQETVLAARASDPGDAGGEALPGDRVEMAPAEPARHEDTRTRKSEILKVRKHESMKA